MSLELSFLKNIKTFFFVKAMGWLRSIFAYYLGSSFAVKINLSM